MNWRSERIWIELITGSRKISNFRFGVIIFIFINGIIIPKYIYENSRKKPLNNWIFLSND
nr:hypothetical chloroplast RF4 [Psammosilene tunicoides]